ncbi:MAG TPA: PadR family transcriptional regulator [Candidatus Cybelea sp.]|jgi:DNA-binding PadR family transcriptional regulator|nr:PadR family transcriptional regulator [Candidatus Elarobacter sp.]HZY96142.1 PadR family transcriptional regulator [Candidatus Cybelea sp.]
MRGIWGLAFSKDYGWEAGWIQRMRRGDVKFAVLEILAEGPQHGYEIMHAIAERRGSKPSPGSVYPTLQMLEDGGFVTSEQVDGKRTYTITDSGRELLANRETEANTEDDGDDQPNARRRVWESATKLGAAVMSVRDSDDKTLDRVRTILDKARKEIYAILASDEA